ncbi:MAG TPA: hypothetical protein PLK06_03125, partial [bacterium]|nr:hypothetical protein [bacterium]
MSEFLFLLSAVVFGLLIVSSFTLRFIADLINVMTPVDYKPRVKPQTTNKIDEMSIFTEECERLIILTTSTPFDPEDVGHENWRLMLWGDEHGPLGIYDNVALIGNRLCSTLVYHLEEGGLIWNDRPRPRQPITSRQILRDAEGKPC